MVETSLSLQPKHSRVSASQLYYVFSFLLYTGIGSTTTIYALYLRSIGLSLGEISLVNSIFWLVVIGAELPTGLLADGKSRVFSLKMGMGFLAVGGLAYFCAYGFWMATIAESLVAIGIAFLSGAQQAWVTDALEREGRSHEIRQVFATEMIIQSATMILAGFFGAVLALISYRLIWIPLTITSVIGMYVVHRWMNGQGEPLERLTQKEAFRQSWNLLLKSRALVWVVGSVVLFGAVVSFNHFWAPFFEPLVGTVGLSWIWAVIFLGCAISGWLVRRVGVEVGNESRYIVLALVLSGGGLFVAGLVGGIGYSIAAVMTHEIGRGMFRPLTDSYIQHRVSSSFRATFGSLQSLIGRIGCAIVPFLVWIGIEGKPDSIETIQNVWMICGGVILVGTIVVWWLRPQTSSL